MKPPFTSHQEFDKWILNQVQQARAQTNSRTAHNLLVSKMMAEVCLQRNCNIRKLNEANIRKMTRDANAGHFVLSNDAVTFNEHGKMNNGQHRMEMIARNDFVLPLVFMFGMSDEDARRAIDTGFVRDPGIYLGDRGATKSQILRAAFFGFPMIESRMTSSELEELCEVHADGVEFVISLFGRSKRGVRSAGVMAVILRAYYHEDHNILRRFVDILYTGETHGKHESAAIKFRKFIEDQKATGSQEVRRGH